MDLVGGYAKVVLFVENALHPGSPATAGLVRQQRRAVTSLDSEPRTTYQRRALR